MSYYGYLKKHLIVYGLSGLILAGALFTLIGLHRYNDYLLSAQGNINSIGVNKFMMKRESEKIDALQKHLQHEFNLDIASSNSDALIFEALDSMQGRLQGSRITISKFKESPTDKNLPVEIDTYVKSYLAILDQLTYIESFRLPDFIINQLIIVRESSGKVLLKIKGSFSMPAFRGAFS